MDWPDRKAFFWQSFSQSIGSCEEATRDEFVSHQWNTNGMWVVRYNLHGIVGLSRELVELKTVVHLSTFHWMSDRPAWG